MLKHILISTILATALFSSNGNNQELTQEKRNSILQKMSEKENERSQKRAYFQQKKKNCVMHSPTKQEMRSCLKDARNERAQHREQRKEDRLKQRELRKMNKNKRTS
jgi:hypothetical protein